MIASEWKDVERILLVRLDNLGDVLLMTPAFRAVRRAFPDAHIALLAGPVGAQAGELNPDIDEVLIFEAPWMDPWHKLEHDSAREQQFISRLREKRYDGAIIFTSFRQSSLPSAYLCYLAGIPLRVAASIDGSGSLLTTRHKHPERLMHEVERALDLVGSIGIEPAEPDLVLEVPDALRDHVSNILRYLAEPRNRPVVVVHPGCTMPARTYPRELYIEVCDLLADELDALVLLTGVEGERDLTGWLEDRTRASTINFAGKLSFAEFAAAIQSADLTITNNTGPMHVAAAVKTPVVALFALTNPPEQWRPWEAPYRQLYHDVSCRICYSRVCPHDQECLRLVNPRQVIQAASELLPSDDLPSFASRAVLPGQQGEQV